jgi:yeast amino acid transporter
LINFSVMTFTFLKWKKACDVQGFDRKALPHTSFWQPYTAYYALVGTTVMAFVGGYTVFLDGFWDVPNFLFSYLMIAVFPALFFGWKLLKKTKWRKPEEVDLAPRELLDEIEAYEASYVPRVPRCV